MDEECTDFVCKEGFLRSGSGCSDVDECRDFPCHDDANCNNLIGGFECRCKDGYSGDGLRCKPTPCGPGEYGTGGDDCKPLPPHADDDGKGDFRCHPGLVTPMISYIIVKVFTVPFSLSVIGVKTIKGFKEKKGTCIDIDECDDRICHSDADCYNSPGFFRPRSRNILDSFQVPVGASITAPDNS